MKRSEGLWTLEYSTEQDCFHINLLEDTLEINLRACLNKSNNDYQIIYIGTQSECHRFFEDLRKELGKD